MSRISFTVANTTSRMANTRFGPKPVYSIVDTVGNTYEAGFKNPSLPVGANVEADVREDKYGKKVENIHVLGAASGPLTPPTPAAATPAARTVAVTPAAPAFPLDPMSREISIIRQNALTNAVNTINYVDSGSTKSDAEYAERILAVARIYADYTSGHDMLKLAEEQATR